MRVTAPWRVRLRRTLAGTRLGQAARRRRRAATRRALLPKPPRLLHFRDEADVPPALRDDAIAAAARAWRHRNAPVRRGPRACSRQLEVRADSPTNVLLVSYSDFTGNGALHTYAVALELQRRGLAPVVAVPRNVRTVDDVGCPPFPIVDYRAARRGQIDFPDQRGVDLVHGFTRRELVRRLVLDIVAAHRCPYVVHLEDDEETIVAAELNVSVEELRRVPPPLLDGVIGQRRMHPARAAAFVAGAAGASVVVERLLEQVPAGLPSAILQPGFDEATLRPLRRPDEVRAELGLAPTDLVLVYTGNVHDSNETDLRALYGAVARLRAAGRRAVLVKTGWNFVDMSRFPKLGGGLRDLGYLARAHVPELLAAADVLVQPGRPGRFDDYRFPSKLPDFLASGRPVVLPRTNLGLKLEDGVEALLLTRGDEEEIAGLVARLADDPDLRGRIGERGRAFALRELRWSETVEPIIDLYRRAAARGVCPDPAGQPPVEIAALDGEAAVDIDRVHDLETLSRLSDMRRPRAAVLSGAPSDERLVRKLVVQALELGEPVVYVEGASDERILRHALVDGIRQFYAASGYVLTSKQAESLVSIHIAREEVDRASEAVS